MTFAMYTDTTTTHKTWGPEVHSSPGVTVNQGLFHVVLGDLSAGGKAIYPWYFSNALYLEVTVDGTALTPRQPLRPSAYAFGIVPGTQVVGDPLGTDWGLAVFNTGTRPDDVGIYATGIKYGIQADETGASGDVGIYSTDFVEARGYKSADDSYVWAPGYAAVSATDATSVTITPTYSGTAHLSTSGTGKRLVYIPLTIPSQLLGQEVAVEELAVYYKVTGGSYISHTVLARMTSPGQVEKLIDNDTPHRDSTTATSYALDTTGNYTLTAEAGPVSIQLGLNFAGASDEIYLYGVRLRLGHVD